jgi:DNA-binding transcriptional LysR family regulator
LHITGAPVNLKQIEAFRATMSCRSVSAAAAQLNISQPSVSRSLANLERAVGFSLFIRRSKGVEPTEEALFFNEEIERVYGALAHLDHVAQDIREGAHGSLNVGAIAAFALEVVPRALARLGVRDNSVSVKLRMRSSQRILDWARWGQIDLGVAHAGVDTSGVDCLVRRSAPYVCLIPKDHPLAGDEGPVPLADLNGERTIALVGETESALRNQAGSRFRRAPLVAEVSFAAAALAEQGAGVAIVDPFTAQKYASGDTLRARPLAGIKPYEFVLVAPIDKRPSQLADRLRELIVDEIDTIARAHGQNRSAP